MGQTGGTKQANARRRAEGRQNAARWFEMRIKGWSVRAIARYFDIAPSTVSQGITRIYEETKPSAEAIEQRRAEELEALDRRKKFWFTRLRKSGDDTEAAERADRSLHRVAERTAKLTGIDTPVKTDPDLIVSTAATAAAATAAAVESRPAAPAIQIVLSSEVGADEEG